MSVSLLKVFSTITDSVEVLQNKNLKNFKGQQTHPKNSDVIKPLHRPSGKKLEFFSLSNI